MDIIHKKTKTIFESDNNLFCLLTMNPHPVHTNVEYAKNAHHGKILVVGTLVLSLAVGITVEDLSFDAIANLEYNDVIHKKPVFIDDTIHVISKIIHKRYKSENRIIQTIQSVVYNQRDEIVLTFTRKILKHE